MRTVSTEDTAGVCGGASVNPLRVGAEVERTQFAGGESVALISVSET